jgi:hypothetical protein
VLCAEGLLPSSAGARAAGLCLLLESEIQAFVDERASWGLAASRSIGEEPESEAELGLRDTPSKVRNVPSWPRSWANLSLL